MDKLNNFFQKLFHLMVLLLVLLYLYPGSILGFLIYGDFGKQPDMIPNPMGTSINHALAFFYLTILGLASYLNERSFKKILIFLIVLSLFLELSHLFIPNRSFQSLDLFANLLGTLLAIVIIFFYKRLKNGKI